MTLDTSITSDDGAANNASNSTTAAMKHLQKLKDEIMSQKLTEPTLAFWRLENKQIMTALETFCKSEEWTDSTSKTDALKEVQELFLELNQIMSEQERTVWSTSTSKRGGNSSPTSSSSSSNNVPTISIIFGGKYSQPSKSISEKLVSYLAEKASTGAGDDGSSDGSHVFTVSRSEVTQTNGAVITHVTKQNLDSKPDENNESLGISEFQNVLQMGINKWNEVATKGGGDGTQPKLVVYFTLGQHKGVNPFCRNIYAANNFAKALETIFLSDDDSSIPPLSCWKIVVTGTDATLPSTTTYSTTRSLQVKESEHSSSNIIDINIPSYHIMEYNYTYAMSKICQYYIIGRSIGKIILKATTEDDCNPQIGTKKVTPKFISEKIEKVITKLTTYVYAAGENGNYPQDELMMMGNSNGGGDGDGDNNNAMDTNILVTMKELDTISKQFMNEIEPALSDNYCIAKNISICYTPLHAVPWTEQALKVFDASSAISSKGYLIEQVVNRFKNAISIDLAAQSHL